MSNYRECLYLYFWKIVVKSFSLDLFIFSNKIVQVYLKQGP